MSWQTPYLFGAETYEAYRIRVLEECEMPPGYDLTLPTDREYVPSDRDHREPRKRLAAT